MLVGFLAALPSGHGGLVCLDVLFGRGYQGGEGVGFKLQVDIGDPKIQRVGFSRFHTQTASLSRPNFSLYALRRSAAASSRWPHLILFFACSNLGAPQRARECRFSPARQPLHASTRAAPNGEPVPAGGRVPDAGSGRRGGRDTGTRRACPPPLARPPCHHHPSHRILNCHPHTRRLLTWPACCWWPAATPTCRPRQRPRTTRAAA